MSVAEQESKALAFLRISIGIIFLIFAEYKLTSTRFIRTGMAQYINQFLNEGSYPFIRPFLQKHHPPPRHLLRRNRQHLRTPYSSQPYHWNPGPLGESRRSDHDAGLTLLFELSRSPGTLLGVLRRLPGTLRSRPLFHRSADRSLHSSLGSPPLQTVSNPNPL